MLALTKQCTNCKQHKKQSDFYWRSKIKNKRQYQCKECHSLLCKKYYPEKKDIYNSRALERKSITLKWFKEYKKILRCEKCGENNSVCLDFHHLDPILKKIKITNAVNNGWKIENIKKEIEKCIVICRNCHAKIHNKKEKIKLWENKNKDEARLWLRNYKENSSCIMCKEENFSCLDFHHVNPEEKEQQISLAATQGWSIKRLEEEVKKCIIVCKNCHIKLHKKIL